MNPNPGNMGGPMGQGSLFPDFPGSNNPFNNNQNRRDPFGGGSGGNSFI